MVGEAAILRPGEFTQGDYPWRDDTDPLFTPQPLEEFLKRDQNITLYPKQGYDLGQLMGSDPKQLFERGNGLPQEGILCYGKGCLGADERLTDQASGETRTVKQWAADGRSLELSSWDGERVVRCQTSPVYRKGEAQLYRVTMSDGRSFVATAKHRCWARKHHQQPSWLHIKDLAPRDYLFALFHDSTRRGWLAIASIDSIGEGDFYDLTVPGTHCYFDSQGLLHHNSGKDFIVSCFMVWAVHVLLCLKDPAVYLGQAPGEPIDVLTVAYTQDQAKSVLFFKIKQRLKASQWFKAAIAKLVPNVPVERYFADSGKFVNGDNLLFPGNIRLWSLPATDAAEGKNPIMWVTDEIAAFNSPTRKNQARRIHKILKTSARTRFQDRWKGFHISYPRHGEDYLMEMIGKAAKGLLPNVYSVVRPTWEVNLATKRSDFDGDYLSDPEGSACAYECKPPAAEDAYFRSPEYLLLNASGAPPALLKELLDLPDEQIDVLANLGRDPIRESDRFGDPVLDRHGFPKLHRWFRGQKDLSGDPYEYFAHLDPGLSGDAFGFCMGHLHRSPQGVYPVLDLAFRWTGRMFKDFGEIHRVGWFNDTQDQTEAIAAKEVDFRTVREFLFYLRQARGFNFGMVSFDGWNSAESVQELRKRDVPVTRHTVKKEDYDEYKALVYSRQMQFYGWPILVNESRKLQLINGTRVEAPRTNEGSGTGADSHKDVSDAAAAVCWRLVRLRDESTEFYTFPPVEDVWAKAKREQEQVRLDRLPPDATEEQRRIFELFLSEDSWPLGL